MNKSFAAITVLAAGLWFASVPAEADGGSGIDGSFPDVVESHWAHEPILHAVAKGYVSGFPDGAFKPDMKVNRAQFIRMLTDALKLPHVERGKPWYQPYVAAAIEFGIHYAADFGEDYDHVLSRLEMIRMVVRAIGPEDAIDGRTDKDYVVIAVEKGLIHGTGQRSLNVTGAVSRAEAVVVIERTLTAIQGGKLEKNEAAVEAAETELNGRNSS